MPVDRDGPWSAASHTVRGIAAPDRLVRLTGTWRDSGPGEPLVTEW